MSAPSPTESKKGRVEIVELSRQQQSNSRRVAESKATVPHIYLRSEVDMTAAVAFRAGLRENASGDSAVPTVNDLVLKAAALALRDHPRANGAYRDGRVELYSRINVGFAVATDSAFTVPVIIDADTKSLEEIAAETRTLAARVRSGEIAAPELAGGTFSTTNLGMFGVRGFDAVVNAGQAGILAVGEIFERKVNAGGGSSVEYPMELSLSCDHRILHGAEGARFLAAIKDKLERPEGLR